MLYWLFTDGKTLFAPVIAPLVCVSILLPIAVTAFMGVGIQRRQRGSPSQTGNVALMGRLSTFIVCNIGGVAIYTSVFGSSAIIHRTSQQASMSGLLATLVGGPYWINQQRLMMIGFGLLCVLFVINVGLAQGMKNGGWLHEWIDRLRKPNSRRGEMGSAHFCTMREYQRFRHEDKDGLTLLGAFWGEKHIRLDLGWGKFCLSGEDASRGILTIGAPGSGKTQGVILPVIADRMLAGHSLIVADPQGEITSHVLNFAKCTRHLVVIHDPTSVAGPRFNLAEGIDNIPAASSIAKVLIPSAQGDNRFWTDSATDLLSACLIRFDNLGQIKAALDDLQQLANRLSDIRDDAALAASAFVASVGADGKVASNTIATLGTALTGWASAQVRANTSASDFNADLIVSRPTVVVLTCPGAMREVYAPYLGAVLRKLMRDLDGIGERNGGPMPVPVGIILDEFPALGRLDSLVADVNLVRKRRISILIAAQTKGQFHLIYGEEGTKALFTGLATQIVYGGGDHDTAKFYSDASGIATVDTDPDPKKASMRQRPLLTTDEIVSPDDGVCHIFSRFVAGNYAAQVILKAQLTRMYERLDWLERMKFPVYAEPVQLGRAIAVEDIVHPNVLASPVASQPAPKSANDFQQQAMEVLQAVRQNNEASGAQNGSVATTKFSEFKRRYGKRRESISLTE